MRTLATPVLLLFLPLAAFLALFHPATLDIGNPGWLLRGEDNGQNALGFHAYRYDSAAGASLRQHLLNAPEGVPVLFTDSNPLATLAAKPFAAWLPADAQVVGPGILISLILQSLFAWLLLRRHAPGPLALWAGVALLAFPPTLANRFVHANLMAHWTILAALWLFLDPARSRSTRWWAALIAVTALIHSYLLVMVGAIWASTLVVRLVAGPRERLAAMGQGAAILLLVGVLAWWLGVGGQVPAGNFGAFSMPLDALWNPSIPAFTRLLPAHEASAGRGFEGFQYLGAGGLLLIAGAVAAAWRLPARPGEVATARRLRALVPALAVLAILAIARLPLPPEVLAALDPVRASGRLFWPVGYVLVLMALLAVYRLPADRAGLALTALFAVQVIDLSGMADAIRAQSVEAGRYRLFARTTDPRWDALVRQARSIAFMPGDVTHCLDVYQEVAWRAAKRGVPVTSAYASRPSRVSTDRIAREEAAFARGDLVSGRAYILRPGVAPPPVLAERAATIDGITVIWPSSPRSAS